MEMNSGELNSDERDGRAQGVPWRKGIERRVNALERKLGVLERTIAAAGDELTTRRLVIVDGHGTARIIGEVAHGCAELRVEVPGEPGCRSGVVVFANSPVSSPVERLAAGSADDDLDGIGVLVGVQLWGGGDSIVELDAWPGASGEWHSNFHLSDGS